MDRDTQELLVLTKAAPYIEQFIKNKYKDLREQKLKVAEKYAKQVCRDGGYVSTSLSKELKEKLENQFGTKAQIDEWEQIELDRLYQAICRRSWTMFPELLVGDTDEEEEQTDDCSTTNC